MCVAGCVCLCECMHAYFGVRSVCAAAQTGRNKKEQPNKAGLLVGCFAGKQVSCSSLSPFLLSALQPAALSGRQGPRKYASLVLGLSAGFILSASLLHVPAQHGSKGRGGGGRRRTRGRMGSVVYLGFRFSCLFTS